MFLFLPPGVWTRTKWKGIAENNQIKDMSIHESYEYWDEHVFDEFGDVLEVKEFQFSFKKKNI